MSSRLFLQIVVYLGVRHPSPSVPLKGATPAIMGGEKSETGNGIFFCFE